MLANLSFAIDGLFTFLSPVSRVRYISYRHPNWGARKRRHYEIPSFLLASFCPTACNFTVSIGAITSCNDRCRTTKVAGRRPAEGAGTATGADREAAVRPGRAATAVDRRHAKRLRRQAGTGGRSLH